jgi:hypothetical protein
VDPPGFGGTPRRAGAAAAIRHPEGAVLTPNRNPSALPRRSPRDDPRPKPRDRWRHPSA